MEPSSTFKPLGRPLQRDWEYEDTFTALPDFHYRARKMIRGMTEQNFPQYIHLDGRDFFYLTRRSLLPGRDLAPLQAGDEAGEGVWRTKGLPQHGFPYAVATTKLRVPGRSDVHLSIARLDPHAIVPAGSPGTDEKTPTVVVMTTPPIRPARGLYWTSGTFSVETAPPAGAMALADASTFNEGPPPGAAFGIDDEERMLVWIDLPKGAAPDESTRAAMKAVFDALGCGIRAAVRGDTHPLLGGSLDAAGDPVPAPTRDRGPHGPRGPPGRADVLRHPGRRTRRLAASSDAARQVLQPPQAPLRRRSRWRGRRRPLGSKPRAC